MQTELNTPTFIPLSEAIKKTNMPEQVLTQQIQEGKLEAVNIAGVLFVSKDIPKTKKQIIEEKFTHLKKCFIGVRDAAKQYKIHKTTLHRWAKAGHIIQNSMGKLDEAEVAYCVHVYREYKQKSGIKKGGRIFDKNGSPYQLKHPALAEKRRNQ